VTITALLSTKTTASGQLIDVPVHPEVVASRYEIAPNATLPMHEHPYPRYGDVLCEMPRIRSLFAEEPVPKITKLRSIAG